MFFEVIIAFTLGVFHGRPTASAFRIVRWGSKNDVFYFLVSGMRYAFVRTTTRYLAYTFVRSTFFDIIVVFTHAFVWTFRNQHFECEMKDDLG
jgi:hypothetical protein